MKILVSALEPSSNLHLSEVLKHTKDIELLGIFDGSLDEYRYTPLYDISDMAIMGVVDAIKKIRWFFKVADEMVELASQADKILLMDSSGFNLPLAKKLKKAYPNKEIIYYILPQVWVTRPKRVKKIERYCDRLLGILPFEIEYYSSKAQYVGHPLLDEIETTSYTTPKTNTISYLPGSRRGEISKLMPIYRELREKLPSHRAILVVPSSFDDEKVSELYGDIDGFEVSRDTHLSLQNSSFAYICSGTATLEAALIGTPFTLNYIAKSIDYFIGTKILGLKQIGLANIIFERLNGTTLHSEIIQDEVTVENLLLEYENFDRELFAHKAQELRDYLGDGSSATVAKIINSDR
ncbi:Lipid-A-disaccharide synthase [hydrothermal vent metagenome]|uniref:lipid-A-disaccharide synthase n=1 Tax=hydrothermal vent metagenome TaxID=652676 RepID=A0A1W1BC52_9ZZZZ